MAAERWGRSGPSLGALTVGVDPCLDLDRIEAQEMAPFDEGDALLVDEAAHVADVDAEQLGDLADGQEPAGPRGVGSGRGGHGDLLSLTVLLQ